MTDKLSWLLVAIQIYIIAAAAIWTASWIGWFLTLIVFAGTFLLAYFELDEDGEA